MLRRRHINVILRDLIAQQRPPCSLALMSTAAITSPRQRPDGFGQNVEWVRFISIIAAATDSVPFDTEEGMHPTYFGQRALASCMTLAVETNAATPRVGCSLSSPLSFGEQALPQMVLQPE